MSKIYCIFNLGVLPSSLEGNNGQECLCGVSWDSLANNWKGSISWLALGVLIYSLWFLGEELSLWVKKLHLNYTHSCTQYPHRLDFSKEKLYLWICSFSYENNLHFQAIISSILYSCLFGLLVYVFIYINEIYVWDIS